MAASPPLPRASYLLVSNYSSSIARAARSPKGKWTRRGPARPAGRDKARLVRLTNPIGRSEFSARSPRSVRCLSSSRPAIALAPALAAPKALTRSLIARYRKEWRPGSEIPCYKICGESLLTSWCLISVAVPTRSEWFRVDEESSIQHWTLDLCPRSIRGCEVQFWASGCVNREARRPGTFVDQGLSGESSSSSSSVSFQVLSGL